MPSNDNTSLTRSLVGTWIDKFLQKPSNAHAAQKVPDHVDAVAKFEHAIKSDAEMVDLFDQAILQAAPGNQVRSSFGLKDLR